MAGRTRSANSVQGSDRIVLSVNGEPHEVERGARLSDLLAQLALGGRRVAVAIDRSVVPRSQHDERELADGDRVEILEAVGGG